jgi:hypothetical protein
MLDGPHVLARLPAPPPRTARILAMVYNNFWYTNFVGDSPGVMEFQFDLLWRERVADAAEAEKLATALVTEPVMMINPALKEHPLFIQHLYKP